MSQTVISNGWRVLEQVSIIAPLGIRFWDPALDVPVNDGLSVIAYPADTMWPATSAQRTPSGVYAFHGLPGLHDVEYPAGNPAGPGSLPAVRRFMIAVTDTSSRFLPVCFSVDAPWPGIYPQSSTIATDLPGFYLFSSPTRPAMSMAALVRAQLSQILDEFTEQPAAFAVLEIDTAEGDTWFGLADARGMVAALFPYPTFTGAAGAAASLPVASAQPQQSWPITLRVRYQPSVLSFPAGSSLPELRSVLAQGPAAIWTQRAAPPGQALASLAATLVFGQELTLRSAQESVLLISLGSLP